MKADAQDQGWKKIRYLLYKLFKYIHHIGHTTVSRAERKDAQVLKKTKPQKPTENNILPRDCYESQISGFEVILMHSFGHSYIN